MRTSPVAFTACAIVLALLSRTEPAAAQSAADRETALSLMDDGDAKRDKGDRAGALKSYQAADALMHVPTTGLEVGRAQVALGLLLEARETLASVVRLPVKPNESPVLAAARKAAEQLSADLAPRIPSLAITVTTSGFPPDAAPLPVTVTVDGEPIPPAALVAPRKVNPGAHVVTARAGSIEKREDVTVAERVVRPVLLDVRPLPPEPPPSPHASSLPSTLVFTGFGVAIVGIGVGAVTGIVSLSKVSSVKDDCTNDHCPADRQSALDSAKTFGTISTIAFFVGGAGAAAGIVGLVLSRRAEKQAAFEPLLGPGFLGARGVF